jgi:diguanylate cyclase (GGDEF)-like protein
MVWGPEIGRPFAIGDSCLIGRGKACDVHVDSPYASREHARVTRTDEGYRIEDLGSQRGTLVNGIAIRAHALCEGDLIAVDAVQLRFHERLETIWEPSLGHRSRVFAVYERVDRALVDWARLALVVLSVDRMKTINDYLGHATGERVLAHVDATLRDFAGSAATVARVGGDTFAVVLCDVDRERPLADEIERCFDERPGPVDAISVTCGVARCTGAGAQRPWQLLLRAKGDQYDRRIRRRYGIEP